MSDLPCSTSLPVYNSVTSQDIARLLARCPSKQCGLDPAPTWLIKDMSATTTPILAKLVNASLHSAIFPTSMKHALVTPIVKKHGLDPCILSSYRPISNLPFISKLLERVVTHQLTTYLNTNHLLPPHQSAYRQHHSTETALLKICSDALLAADRGMVTLVVLLDLSAAFDTVNYKTLLDTMEGQFNWHRSYLSGRTYCVVTGDATSDKIVLDCGLPQGSSLGPLKFIIYAADLEKVVERHEVSFHGFADDSQLSKHMLVKDITAGKNAMISCITSVELWCRSHGLKLNADKSEVIWLGTRQQLAKLNQSDKELHFQNGVLQASETARNLGVTLDGQLSFDKHARACSRACIYHLRRIRQIRRYIDDDSLKLLVHAAITSRLDYCNALFAGSSVAVRQRLQRIQNCAARLVCSEPTHSNGVYHHTTPLLQRLHWLPVDRRITYKLCVLMFDVLHGIAPVYLSEMCSRCSDSRLRSSSQGNFVVTRTRTRLADSSFAVAGPAAWNSLPVSLKNIESHSTFCPKLKTHLFIAAFNCRCAKFYNFLLIRFYYVKRC